MAEKYQHLFLTESFTADKYKQGQRPGGKPIIPIRDRAAHSRKLLEKFTTIWEEKKKIQQERFAESIPTREGTYLEFVSGIDADLITKSLESISKGIRLLNIREVQTGEQIQTKATVYIPNGLEGFFIKKISDYETTDTKSHKPKNAPLVESIEDVGIALLEALWTDRIELLPTNFPKWCEVWLNIASEQVGAIDDVQKFTEQLKRENIPYKENYILFPERAVILINANRNTLIELMLSSDLLAEFRAGQETAGFWMNEGVVGQQQWVNDLLQRLQIAQDSNIKVCILDSGANNAHPLLNPILVDADTLTVDEAWGTADHEAASGHGTMMAGIVGYGSLEEALADPNTILITHKLCSVKILPPNNQEGTPKELWGAVTSQGISRAEIQNPDKVLLFCMAVTSVEDVDRGRPSSWSGAIDNLSYGNGENKRLIIISAGNVEGDDLWKAYPDSNLVSSIQNPAQSWNALTVGAYTRKVIVNDPNFNGHTPVAPNDGLSPFSSSSTTWERKWPIKPDVVFEGGNILKDASENFSPHHDLELLSTSKRFLTGQSFDTFGATSAATAQASWFSGKIASEYPNLWPETTRALVVHSAEWRQTMFDQFGLSHSKTNIGRLMRIFGYGIPNIQKALYSSESSLSMIAQEVIQPFTMEGSNPILNEMHFYKLPFPKEMLLQLNTLPVKLRITLSYFVEPGAGEIGWKDKYRYQSHGLRFDLNNVSETEMEFKKRINVAARAEGEKPENNSGSERWTIGSDNRSNGSIHSDFWEGTAAELATCNMLSVFPIIGWWRERKQLNKVETKTRYSLVLSLETAQEDIQLYTAIKNMIQVPVVIENKIA